MKKISSGNVIKKGRKKRIVVIVVVGVLLFTAPLIAPGLKMGWGPFSWLNQFDNTLQNEANAIKERYDAGTRRHEIIFYGASNFRLWTEMEKDLAEYKVQNHGFGGSTDKSMMKYADQLLYPYQPDIVFFQTGSNDYVGLWLSGTDAEKVKISMAYKKVMFDTFHRQLPDAKFVVMSGLLLPGRNRYADLTNQINAELKAYCNSVDYMVFVDATTMTYNGQRFDTSLFEKDGIHLNREGQLRWCNEYIRPRIESLIIEYGLTNLRRN
jgi:lysophospholipase L1-like esterase